MLFRFKSGYNGYMFPTTAGSCGKRTFNQLRRKCSTCTKHRVKISKLVFTGGAGDTPRPTLARKPSRSPKPRGHAPHWRLLQTQLPLVGFLLFLILLVVEVPVPVGVPSAVCSPDCLCCWYPGRKMKHKCIEKISKTVEMFYAASYKRAKGAAAVQEGRKRRSTCMKKSATT